MRFFDLHSDTLYKAHNINKHLDSDCFHFSKKQSELLFEDFSQCLAIWIPDDLPNISARELFDACLRKFNSEVSSDDKKRLILTLENARIIEKDLNYIYHLKESGIRIITLTWNAENCIGGGADTKGKGLTDFGKKALKVIEDNNIIVDISHASDMLFYDVLSNTSKPIVATHSNARSLCGHRRNLTDEQFIEIVKRKGLVGLNFCEFFLNNEPSDASALDVLRHAYHFLSLGGEDVLAIGTDFDGADVPRDLMGTKHIPYLYETFIKGGFNQQIVQKIMYDNAHNFCMNF